MESIYLLIEREFLQSNLPIYKIGRSSQENDKRIKQYPKGSRLICLINVEDSKIMEKEIISLFKHKYVQRRDIGSEYFEGNVVMMRKDIFDMVMEYDCVGFSECKKRQRGLKKLVLKELTKRINNSVTVVAEVKKSPIENIAVPIGSSNPIPTYISTGPYTCESCKYSTSRITLYKGHLKTKKHIAMQSSETSDGFKHICAYCSKKYVNITGLKKHKIKCASRIKHEEDIVLANQLATRKENEQKDLLAQQVLKKEEIKKEITDELMKELFLRFSGQGTITSLNR